MNHGIRALRDWRASVEGRRVAFVPTMGALHDGHLSLVEIARGHADVVAASVFVNPTQFDDPRDFELYPRTFDADARRLRGAGVDFVFAPGPDEMYPPETADVVVDVPSLTDKLEGVHRPGHFRGVCRVVLKLLNLVRPAEAVFGMKDFQQLRVIEAISEGLDLPVTIVRGPTLRDPDGLAMSSRNARLTPAMRSRALAIPLALEAGERALLAGDSRETVEACMADTLAGLDVDYAAAVDPRTLRPWKGGGGAGPALLAVAARVGDAETCVRLIDNRLIDVAESDACGS